MKIAILACAGSLPLHLLAKARADGKNCALIAVKGFCDPETIKAAEACFSFASFARAVDYLKAHHFTHIVMAGHLVRPSLLDIRFEFSTLNLLRKHRDILIGGDDHVLKRITHYFESEKFTVLGVQDIDPSLLASVGTIVGSPNQPEYEDIGRIPAIATALSSADIGQACIIHHGSVLAVEAREGTDAMIERVAHLRNIKRIRGRGRFGILAKFMKPTQDPRLDTPVIGLKTIEKCIEARLAGIAISSGKVIILQQDEVYKTANKHKLFLYGFPFERGHNS